jgi:hypothetical protein
MISNAQKYGGYMVICDYVALPHAKASDGVNNHYSGINNVQRRDNSSYEIVCSRRVNEIELVLLTVV